MLYDGFNAGYVIYNIFFVSSKPFAHSQDLLQLQMGLKHTILVTMYLKMSKDST